MASQNLTFTEDWYIPDTVVLSYLNFANLCLVKSWFGDDPHNLKRKNLFIVGMSLQSLLNVAPFIPSTAFIKRHVKWHHCII